MARDRLARVALVVGGGQLLAISLSGLVAPERLLGPLGIALEGRLALSEIRAAYGGKNLALALVVLAAAVVPRLRFAGLVIVTAVMSGLVIGRTGSAVVDGPPGAFAWLLVAVESATAGLALLALRTGR